MLDIAELLAERTRLEKEQREIVEQIHELRRRAKEKTLLAADTHQVLDPSEIAFWKRGITANQEALMKVQAELGALNKAIRKVQAAEVKPVRARTHHDNNNDENVFLSCFHLICQGSLDPRLLAALERDANNLAEEHRKMHQH